MVNNYIFIHYCFLERWREIVLPQLERLTSSPFYSHIHTIYISKVGPFMEEFILPSSKFKVVFEDLDPSGFEFPPLSLIWEKAREETCRILYLHGKGISHFNKFPQIQRNIKAWREYMEYFLLDRAADCLVKLEDYDTVGVEYRSFPVPHFSGNFWWANSDHIRRLPDPRSLDQTKKFLTEFWITQPRETKVFCPYNFGLDLYSNFADPQDYMWEHKDYWRETDKGWRIRRGEYQELPRQTLQEILYKRGAAELMMDKEINSIEENYFGRWEERGEIILLNKDPRLISAIQEFLPNMKIVPHS